MSETVNVPDVPGIGGVLSVYLEDGALGALWSEINQALNDGWIVCVFSVQPGKYTAEFVDSASVDESGEDPVYTITIGETSYTTDDPKKAPSSGGGDNLVGSAIVGTATAG